MLCGLTAVGLRALARSREPICNSSSPASGDYVVTLCLENVTDNATLNGSAPISVSFRFAGSHPNVRQLFYSLGDETLSIDLATDDTFVLPTDEFPDGAYQLQVWLELDDGFASDPIGVAVVFENGNAPQQALQDSQTSTETQPAAASTNVPTVSTNATATSTPNPARAIAPNQPPTRVTQATASANAPSARAGAPAATNTPSSSATSTDSSNTDTSDDTDTDTDTDCYGTISGAVFIDGVAAPNIDLDLNDDTGGLVDFYTSDDPGGQFTFYYLSDGAYNIIVYDPTGYDPSTVSVPVTIANCADVQKDVQLSSAAGSTNATPTGTITSAPTATATATATTPGTNGATATATRTATPTSTSTGTITTTVTVTRTPTPTRTPTATRTATRTPTAKAVATATRTLTPTRTPKPTKTPTASPTATSTRTKAPAGTNIAVADTWVSQNNPNTIYGDGQSLRLDGSPDSHAYLRFTIQGVTGTITKVTLRVFANTASTTGYSVRVVNDNTWTEAATKFANAPAVSATNVGSSGAFGAGRWTTIDVTALITGNGTFNLALVTSGGAGINLASRETGANAPHLVLQTTP